MKIAINAFSAKAGGGKTYLYNLLRNIPDEISEVFLFCHDDLDYGKSKKIVRIKTGFPVYNPISRLFWERFLLPRWLKRNAIDLLFVPGGVVNTAAPAGCRVITMFRNMLPFSVEEVRGTGSRFLRAKNWLLAKSMLRSMASADLVIFISEYANKLISGKIKIKSSVLIPHGISEDFFCAEKSLSRPDFLSDGPYILYVSRFDFYKRHLQVVQAYSQLSLAMRRNYKLVLAGGADSLYAEQVREYIEENGLSESVSLLGDVPYESLPSLYRNADLFVFASVCENCPNILLEAMGAGLPIVCSSFEPMPEFAGDSAKYVSPDDVAAMSAAIKSVLENDALKRDMSVRSALRSKNFSWTNAARRTWEELLKI